MPAYQAAALLRDPEALWSRLDAMSLEDLRQLAKELCQEVVFHPRTDRRTPFGRRFIEVAVRGEKEA